MFLVKPRLIQQCRGSIPVAISLSFYQSTPVSKTFTSLGFLVAIIAVVTVNVLPRAKLLELTFGICSLTAIAIPLAMLATWSGLQARFHTDPNGLHAYNSSQSGKTGKLEPNEYFCPNTFQQSPLSGSLFTSG